MVRKSILPDQQLVVIARNDYYFLAFYIPNRMSYGLERKVRNYARQKVVQGTS